MLHNTKCECGHQNPVGTVLCESCGKPLDDEFGTAPLEMRYDGIARRSQRENPALIDRVWRFFSSVKVAIILIFLTLCASIMGTIYPQENTFLNVDPSVYYEATYGFSGKLYYLLGLSDTYGSWWYKLLLIMIGSSLIICSLDRVLPLYRALSKQQIRKHMSFLVRQRVVYQGQLPATGITAVSFIDGLVPLLKKRGYRVHSDGTALLAEKHRFSRWGPYINHIGLIIFLLAVLMRGLPGWSMDQYTGFLEGVPTQIENTPYYLENEKFTVEYYTEEELPEEFRGQGRAVPKLFQTKAILYECTADCSSDKPDLKQVHQQNIEVNKPLKYKDLLAYQFDFRQTIQIRAVNVSLTDKMSNQTYGPFELNTITPDETYVEGPYVLTLKDYYPEFALNDKGVPFTNSKSPLAPAFIFVIQGPGLAEDGEVFIYFPRDVDKQRFSQDKLNAGIVDKIDIGVGSMQDVSISRFTSYLNIRTDRALPYIFFGGIIFMIGVIMGIYWQHRRIWIRIDDENEITIGAHTSKNWFGIRKELSVILGKAGIVVEPKQLENGVKQA
ncbi:MAG: cytochrome c biogenesis protein ResB [Paenibacillaceae bacterium]